MLEIAPDPKLVRDAHISAFEHGKFRFQLLINGPTPGVLLQNYRDVEVLTTEGNIAPEEWPAAFAAARRQYDILNAYWLVSDNHDNGEVLALATLSSLVDAARHLSESPLLLPDRHDRGHIYVCGRLLLDHQRAAALHFPLDVIENVIWEPESWTTTEWVYLVASSTGAYKIGRTKTPEDRMRTFRLQLPFEVDYAALIPCRDMRQLEKALHDAFKDMRLNGEWFLLDEADVARIAALGAARHE